MKGSIYEFAVDVFSLNNIHYHLLGWEVAIEVSYYSRSQNKFFPNSLWSKLFAVGICHVFMEGSFAYGIP
jgi:hypothetical protein